MSEINIQNVPTDDPLYQQSLELRDRVLRQPLGMSLWNENLEGEAYATHIIALYDNKVVGVLLLKPIDSRTLQMKQVAVDPALRGQNIGRKLVHYAEHTAREEGYCDIMLHARQVAIPFYEKLAYQITGEPFTEIGIPHRIMVKSLIEQENI
ncbi:GNAT family N-acetyltransferase [Paenibacillus bovis]|uniref:GNAT family N-acetyltransferase n=1 Tax=Paenibacillus bovis TaxID=1616788 RepID=A0A172ZH37_9BACL|nr:GNAT family N-acetyltransferase [Paenibacillus bovis]ANF96951.1 GNAT family N-acetyltransferase [Paenibacillus bovis]